MDFWPYLPVSLLDSLVGSTILLVGALYIDTSDSEKIVVKFDDLEFVEDAKIEKAQKLLSVIEKLLKKKKAKVDNVTSIEINSGPGSYTGLRVGVSVANALGWLLDIPVNGENVRKDGPIEPIYS